MVLGIGMSSKATAQEVRSLVHHALSNRQLLLADVSIVATRDRFVLDARLDLGKPVTGVADDCLVAASAPCARSIGLPARVAETAALLTAGTSNAALLGPVERSAHVTVAVARPHHTGVQL